LTSPPLLFAHLTHLTVVENENGLEMRKLWLTKVNEVENSLQNKKNNPNNTTKK
jgi:hypothetical protein